jgi:ribose/xylose/arabinose/galactoside ABC-type transport system permease subunit
MARVPEALRSYLMPAAVLIVTWLVIAAITPSFRGEASIYSVLEGFALVGLVALGLSVTIIAGELDLSVGSMAGLAAIIMVLCEGLGLIGAIAVATAAGVLFGAVQGTLIGRLGINSLVFTIGTLILLRGVTWMAAGHEPIMIAAFEITDPMLDRFWIFSWSSITALAMFALVALLLGYTRWGREIHAIGGGRAEAVAAGVPRVRPISVAFAISGGCAALAGALAAARGGSAAPQNYADLLLTGAAAALLGGVSLYGGRGTVINVALGVAILSAVGSGLAARGTSASLVQLVTGALLLVVIGGEFLAGRLARRERRGAGAGHG